MQPKEGFLLKTNHLLKLLEVLYRLTDSSSYWHDKMRCYLMTDLKIKLSTEYLAYFVKTTDGILQGIVGRYVDDVIITGQRVQRKEQCNTTSFCI